MPPSRCDRRGGIVTSSAGCARHSGDFYDVDPVRLICRRPSGRHAMVASLGR